MDLTGVSPHRFPRRRLLAALAAAAVSAGARAAEDRADYLGRTMPYAAFDRLPLTPVDAGSGRIDVAMVLRDGSPQRQELLEWIGDSVRAIVTYFGRFPVARLRLLIVEVPGSEIHGTTWGYAGAATRIRLGERAADVRHNWVLTHELVHVSMPDLPEEQIWLSEGLATYVEPVARAQAGLLSIDEVWQQFLWGMPKGLPAAGDQGLDNTHSWGRTYWGGALFCLLADLEIRQRSGNRRGLQDALRAIVAAGGNTEAAWPLDRFLTVGDDATGVPALHELYATMRATPVSTDLADLWRRLGVAMTEGKIAYDDAAPLAEMRRAITRRRDA